MICILEPKPYQALSGSFLFNKELVEASHGKIERYTLDADQLSDFDKGERLLFDSAWMFTPEARLLAKADGNGFLVHSLPEKTSDWKDLLAECSLLIASSQVLFKRLESELPDHRILLCEPGVDTRIRSLQAQPREHDLLRLITVANIMPRKGFDDAVDFLAALEDQGLRFHWYIVGEPAPDRDFNGHSDIDELYFDELTGSLGELGWEDQVTFVGSMAREQQLRLYLNMDVVLFPSRAEDFGIALLEAAQLGLPVLTTDVGIAGELFQGDEQALVLPAPLSVKSVPFAFDFLQKYSGLEKNVRVKRSHPRLERSWGKAADELLKKLQPSN